MNSPHQLPIILASRSPRRRELLGQIGIKFEIFDLEIDESVLPGEDPLDYVLRMATHKAHSAWQNEAIEKAFPNYRHRALVAADTSVVMKDQILGKPENAAAAELMLRCLSDQTHQVITSVALINQLGITHQTSVTKVTFAKLAEHKIKAYCLSGEGSDKAGGYAIQGAAAQFVKTMNGSYSGVVGLPLYETSILIEAHYAAVSSGYSEKQIPIIGGKELS